MAEWNCVKCGCSRGGTPRGLAKCALDARQCDAHKCDCPGVAVAPATIIVAKVQQVSHNGRTWVDYKSITDSDAFETYKHRRVLKGGKVVEEHGNEIKISLKPVAALGTCSWQAMKRRPDGVVTVWSGCKELRAHAKAPYCEKHIADAMQRRDAARPPIVQDTRPPAQAHTIVGGGVWSLREQR